MHYPGEADRQFTLEVKRTDAAPLQVKLHFAQASDKPVRASRDRQRKARRERQGKAVVFGDVRVLSAAGSTTGDGHEKIDSDAFSI